jgi:hypothetical protein
VTDLNKASAEAVEAAKQGDQYAAIIAALQTAAIVQQLQQPAAPPVVQPQPSSAGKWIGIGIGGSVFLMTLAVCAVAVAVAAVSVALVAVVIYAIWRDIRKR